MPVLNKAFSRAAKKRLQKALKSKYAENQPTVDGVVVGSNLVSINGQVQRSTTNGTAVGTVVAVQNVGTAANAVYSAGTGGAVLGGGSNSGGATTVEGAHALSDTSMHTGTLADAQAPQFALLNGLRAYTGTQDYGNNDLTNVGLINGIDITEVGTLTTFVAGAGLTGGGTSRDATVTFDVNPGAAITISGDAVAVNHDSTLHTPGDALSVKVESLAGDGLHWLGTQLLVQTDTTTRINGDAVGVDLTANFSWTGRHYHADTISSDHWASGTTGWGMTRGGDLDARNITADTLTVDAFIADINLALAGSQFITKSLGTVAETYTTPALSGSGTFSVYDLPGFADTQVFEDGDWVRLRYIERSTGLAVGDVWGTVTSYSDQSDGTQDWTFNHQAGSASKTIHEGMIALDYGASGQGIIESTVIGSHAPYIDVKTWTTNPYTPENYTVHVRMGKLSGISDANLNPSGYGIYTDNFYGKGDIVAAAGDARLTSRGLIFRSGETSPTGNISDLPEVITWTSQPESSDNQYVSGFISAERVTGASISDTLRLQVDAGTGQGSNVANIVIGAYYDDGTIVIPEAASLSFVVDDTDSTAALLAHTEVSISTQASGQIRVNTPLIIPNQDVTTDIGTPSKRINHAYIANLHVGTQYTTDTGHDHDNLYYTQSVVDSKVAARAPLTHSHAGYALDSEVYDRDYLDSKFSNYSLDTHTHGSLYVPLTRSIQAGHGLSGGGALSATVTLSVHQGDGVNVDEFGVAVDSTVARRDSFNDFAGDVTVTSGNQLILEDEGNALRFVTTDYTLGKSGSVLQARTAGDFAVYRSSVGTAMLYATVDTFTHSGDIVWTQGNVAAGSGITIVENSGTITISSTGGGGTGTVSNWTDFPTTGGIIDGSDLADIGNRLHSLLTFGEDDHHAKLHSLDDTAHHSGTLSWAKVSKTGSDLADLTTRAHSSLTGIQADDHHDPISIASGSDEFLALNGQEITFTGGGASGFVRKTGDTILSDDVNKVPLILNTQASHATNLFVVQNNGSSVITIDGSGTIRNAGTNDQDIGTPTAPFRALWANALQVNTLVSQEVTATIGGNVLVANTAQLTRDLGASDTTIYININSFANGEFAYMAGFVSGVPQREAVKFVSGPTEITAGEEYSYTVERAQSFAGEVYFEANPVDAQLFGGLFSTKVTVPTGGAWSAETAIASTGATVGSGFIDLAATSTALGHVGPTMTVYARTGTTSANQVANVVSIGKLSGLLDYATNEEFYGFAVGTNNALTPNDPTYSGLTGDQVNGVRLFNTTLQNYDAEVGAVTVVLDNEALRIGPDAANMTSGSGAGIYIGKAIVQNVWDEEEGYTFRLGSDGAGGSISFGERQGLIVRASSVVAGAANMVPDGINLKVGGFYGDSAIRIGHEENPDNGTVYRPAVLEMTTAPHGYWSNVIESYIRGKPADQTLGFSFLNIGATDWQGNIGSGITFNYEDGGPNDPQISPQGTSTFAGAVRMVGDTSSMFSHLGVLNVNATGVGATLISTSYLNSKRFDVKATDTTNELNLLSFDNGENGYGPMLFVGRNSNDTKGSPGVLAFVNRDDETWYYWADRNGGLRRGQTRPTYDTDVSAGTLIG